jgi:hypothetical protein
MDQSIDDNALAIGIGGSYDATITTLGRDPIRDAERLAQPAELMQVCVGDAVSELFQLLVPERCARWGHPDSMDAGSSACA